MTTTYIPTAKQLPPVIGMAVSQGHITYREADLIVATAEAMRRIARNRARRSAMAVINREVPTKFTYRSRDFTNGLIGRPGSDPMVDFHHSFLGSGIADSRRADIVATVPMPRKGSAPIGTGLLTNDQCEGLSEVLPYSARGQGWEAWQGSHFAVSADVTRVSVKSDGTSVVVTDKSATVDSETGLVTHSLPGARPGDRKPRVEHVAWCSAPRITTTGRAIGTCRESFREVVPAGSETYWTCSIHGDTAVIGASIPAAIDNADNAAPVISVPTAFTADRPITWSDQSRRVQQRKERSRKTGRTSIVTTRGEVMRPEPSEPMSAAYSWTPRLRASSADGSRILVYRIPAMASLSYGPAGLTDRTWRGGRVIRPSAYRGSHLLAVRKSDGKPYKVRRALPATAMAALVRRDAAAEVIHARAMAALPKSVRKPRAASISLAAGRKGADTRAAKSAARLARFASL